MVHRSPWFVAVAVLGAALSGCSPLSATADAGTPPRPLPLRVATWNLRQLGVDGGLAGRHGPLLASLEAGLVTVQEVVSEAAFADLARRLDDAGCALGPLAATAGDLRQGFLWRVGAVVVREVQPLFEDQPAVFPRPPLQARVELRDPATGEVRASVVVIAVHLKAGARAADEDKRVQALALLEAKVRALTGGGDEAVLLLGDFNETPSDPRSAEAFAPFTGAPERYRWLTQGFADAGQATYLPRGLVFDHLVATAALDGPLDGGLPTVRHLEAGEASYLDEVSDHLPVVLDLTFP